MSSQNIDLSSNIETINNKHKQVDLSSRNQMPKMKKKERFESLDIDYIRDRMNNKMMSLD